MRLGGENPDEVSDDPREFLNKPRWQRILVYLAGPAMNVILAIVLFAALFMVGIEVTNLPDAPALIGGVEAKSSAAQAGLRRGDLILAVKGEPVDNWRDVAFTLMGSPEKAVPLTVKRDGQTVQASVTPRRGPTRKTQDIGDLGGLVPSLRPQIIMVVAGQPAEAAGFQFGRRDAGRGRPNDRGQQGLHRRHLRAPRPTHRGPGGARRPAAGAHRDAQERRRHGQDRRRDRLLPALRPGPGRGRERPLQHPDRQATPSRSWARSSPASFPPRALSPVRSRSLPRAAPRRAAASST